MSQRVIAGAQVYLNEFDVGAEVSAFQITTSSALIDTTTIEDTTITRAQGIPGSVYAYEGFWNNDFDSEVFGNLGSNSVLMTVCPETGAETERSFHFQGLDNSYTPGGSINEMFSHNVSGEVEGDVYQGNVMFNRTVSATTSGAIQQLGSISSTQKLYMAYHFTALTGSANVEILTVSDDNALKTSPTQRHTTGLLSAVGSGVVEISGPITDDYWYAQCNHGGTGNITMMISFSIK